MLLALSGPTQPPTGVVKRRAPTHCLGSNRDSLHHVRPRCSKTPRKRIFEQFKNHPS